MMNHIDSKLRLLPVALALGLVLSLVEGLAFLLAGCPFESIETNETEHFVVRWCNDSYHSNYPLGGDAGLRQGGEYT